MKTLEEVIERVLEQRPEYSDAYDCARCHAAWGLRHGPRCPRCGRDARRITNESRRGLVRQLALAIRQSDWDSTFGPL